MWYLSQQSPNLSIGPREKCTDFSVKVSPLVLLLLPYDFTLFFLVRGLNTKQNRIFSLMTTFQIFKERDHIPLKSSLLWDTHLRSFHNSLSGTVSSPLSILVSLHWLHSHPWKLVLLVCSFWCRGLLIPFIARYYIFFMNTDYQWVWYFWQPKYYINSYWEYRSKPLWTTDFWNVMKEITFALLKSILWDNLGLNLNLLQCFFVCLFFTLN